MAPETFSSMGSPIHWARTYDLGTRFMMLGRGNSFRRRVLDLALLKNGEGFLDIGCGPGRLVMEACKRVGRLGAVYGVDISPQMIHLARKKAARSCPNAEFRQAAAQALPFDAGFFDAITISFVVHHLPNDQEKLRAFREMHRALRKGGRLVVVDFVADEAGLFSHMITGHMAGGGAERYPDMMRAAGFGRIDTGVAALGIPHFVRGYAE